MGHAYDQAARHGMARLVLDVLPAREVVIGFYSRLGYAETEPFETESPVRMIFMERGRSPATASSRLRALAALAA